MTQEPRADDNYLNDCPFHRQCEPVLCVPWGMASNRPREPELRLLMVGLNANEQLQNNYPHTAGAYSEYVKNMMRKEVAGQCLKCLSNFMPPLAHLLYTSEDVSCQRDAIEQLEWCNLISCCPNPLTRGESSPSGRPTPTMRKNCLRRLSDKAREFASNPHELVRRIAKVRPTHIVVLGCEAKNLWKRAVESPGPLRGVLDRLAGHYKEIFTVHPSCRWPRDRYKRRVIEDFERQGWRQD
jgi:hypothetical protein